MEIDLQPNFLKNKLVTLVPLQESDFDGLYNVASNPLVWEQHPNPSRYQKEVFRNYFEGAMLSKGAMLVLDTKSYQVIGCSRFYDLDLVTKSIKIGYTFIGIDFWGGGFNKSMKSLMINHAFESLDKIYFDVGATNIRSQIAIERVGAIKIEEKIVEYYGEKPKLNFVYIIEKEHPQN
jgi:N-acetyltransferase